MPSEKPQVTFVVEEEILAALQQLAAQQDRSVAWLCRKAVEGLLEQEHMLPPPNPNKLRKRKMKPDDEASQMTLPLSDDRTTP